MPLADAARLLREGRPDQAVPLLRHAARARPEDAALHHDLGLACLEAGQLPDAIAALRHATLLNPRHADSHFRLGIALERAGQAPAAVAAYDRATELLPSLSEAWYRAGALVLALGHRTEAIGCFRRAAAGGAKRGFARLGHIRALLADGRDEEAARALRGLLALEPGNALALDLLGSTLADAGRFEEARDCFARAVAAAPGMAGLYYDLARCRPFTPADAPLHGRMAAALDTPGLDPEQRLRLHLALAKAADDLDDPEAAMRHAAAAGALRQAIVPFDPAAFDAEIDRMIARFPADVLARAPAFGSPDATPILVIGMPRSGTTLVEHILSSHPAVQAGGELNFWADQGEAWLRAGGRADDPAFLARAAAEYRTLLGSIGPGAARVTDKRPFNFLWAGLIHLAFPNAIFVHCRRAPIDTALSIQQTYFSLGLAFPTGGPALVAYFRAHARLMDHWRRVLPPGRLIDVDYADLTGAPEPAIRRLIAACGLPWDDACLAPERNPRPVRTPSRWQARQPIYAHAVDRWRRYEPWLGALRPLLDET